MSRFKQFEIAKAETAGEGPSFGMADQVFQCLPVLPVAAIAELTKDSGGIVQAVAFFEAVLIPEDVVRFHTLLADKVRVVTGEIITEVLSWLVEEYTARPTELLSTLSGGQQSTSNGLTAVSSEAE